ncbi:DUF429 domain-containing protein [Paenibacillus silvisoli]|uniref:DUF429 domain-containing protein n=1 Tax=Paenibacillus silvisoli TaxID=3110539 RepID=UPI0028044A86|nr:DUF429 domain-containing protein [Paenibacillus silvisoli]
MYIGVDGAQSQWVAAIADRVQGVQTIRYVQVAQLEELWAEYGAGCRKLLIDMPLGLRASGKRSSEEQVMELLGPVNKKRCFHSPSYHALKEWQRLQTDEGSRLSPRERYDAINGPNVRDTGLKLTPPGYALVPRIANVREFVLSLPDRALASEAHPEICFMALGNRDSFSSKHRLPGIFERLAVIEKHFPNYIDYMAKSGSLVWNGAAGVSAKLDDLLDATILALTAQRIVEHPDSLVRLTEDPPEDDPTGLPVEIVYAKL